MKAAGSSILFECNICTSACSVLSANNRNQTAEFLYGEHMSILNQWFLVSLPNVTCLDLDELHIASYTQVCSSFPSRLEVLTIKKINKSFSNSNFDHSSVCNTLKRAFLIWFSVYIFQNQVGLMSAIGTFFVIVGVLFYIQAKNLDKTGVKSR